MESFALMNNNKYIIKSLAPWMIDELIAFSQISNFELIFLRQQNDFYKDGLKQLESNGVKIYVKPFAFNSIIKKTVVLLKFLIHNLLKFRIDYNGVIGLKSMIWFLRLDLKKFSPNSNIHAQFATQSALISYLIKKYYNNQPQYSFTFHAHDIYFSNKWFNLLVDNCYKAFSISEYNISYVVKKFLDSDKIILSRLGVFRNEFVKNNRNNKAKSNTLKLGLISWFVEKKGIIYLLQAMLNLKEQGYSDIKLILAGDGPLREDFLEFIHKNSLTQSIDYIGKIKGQQKIDFFNDIDIFVLPSISLENDKDGIPVVLMEAIAASLPIISTDVSGIPEICYDDYNGLLVEQKNDAKLVEAISHVKNNEHKRQQYAENSFVLSKEYDIILNSKSKLKALNW